MFSNYSNTTFFNNKAESYGGALHINLAQTTIMYNLKARSMFQRNYARISGYSLYVVVTVMYQELFK